MARLKQNNKYYFSVEGDTEKWYLEHLQKLINDCADATCTVKINVKIEKNPVKMVKALTVSGKTTIWHLSDYESDEPVHTQAFIETMDNLKASQKMGKQVKYMFGYSNLSFDLWIVLHKANCNGHLAHRSHYLTHINRAFGEAFLDMDAYKTRDNFNRCLDKITLSDVQQAIERAKTIMETNASNGYTKHEYKGYYYYKENPSLEIWQAIENILKDCGI